MILKIQNFEKADTGRSEKRRSAEQRAVRLPDREPEEMVQNRLFEMAGVVGKLPTGKS